MSKPPVCVDAVLREQMGRPVSRRSFVALLGAAALSSSAPSVFACRLAKSPSDAEQWHERMQPLMSTYVSIAVAHNDRAVAMAVIDRCYEYISELIAQLSSWQSSSIISQLSRDKTLHREVLTPEVSRLCAVGERMRACSQGAFNLLIDPLTALWRESAERGSRPQRSEIASMVRVLRKSRVAPSDGGLQIDGFGAIDVGGIGKGLIADCACDFLGRLGIRNARVACSGDLRFLGDGPWKVEIRDPDGGGELTSVRLDGPLAISTSGVSETAWDAGGETYHHLIDPRTGEPGRAHKQVTVVASTGAVADSLASALFLIDPGETERMISQLGSVYFLSVDRHGTVREGGSRSLLL